REYRVGVSQIPYFPSYGWVMHGAPPAPAGYEWYSDVSVSAPTADFDLDGVFLVFGQVRTVGGSPHIIGMASIRGHALDENTLNWETPQLIESFGAQVAPGRYIDALSIDVEPNSNNVYITYLNLNVDTPYKALLFRISPDLGTTWPAG